MPTGEKMVGWFTTSDGWKFVEYVEGDPESAMVFEPRKWWQLIWRKRPASAAVRNEVVKTLTLEAGGNI